MSHQAVVVDELERLQQQNRLQDLTIADTGFVFDAVSGHSFTVNHSAKFILKRLAEFDELSDVVSAIEERYRIPRFQAEQSVSQFIQQLGDLLV